MLPDDLLKQMKEECKESIFLDEAYDSCILGYDGMTGSIIYDIDKLSELEVINMNFRHYDFRVAINGGACFYEFEDALKYWEIRFADTDQMQRRGQLSGKFAPSYFIKVEKEGNELPFNKE